MNSKKDTALSITLLTVGEIVLSLFVVVAFLTLDLLLGGEFWDFSYKIVTGVALGTLVTILNYVFLTVSVNRAINNFLAIRGDRAMEEDEAVDFASKNAMGIQNAIKTSFLVRTVSILITLIIAFIIDWFSPIATVIPLLAYRPLLSLCEMIKAKLLGSVKTETAPAAITYEEHEVEAVSTDVTDNNSNEKESDA